MLGAIVRQTRLEAGLSQERLARRAGTRQATISRIERDLEEPSFARFEMLMRVMGRRVELHVAPVQGASRDGRAAAALLAESASWNHVATELEIAAARQRA